MSARAANVFIGVAGWSIPREHARHFPVTGSHLERYASRFDAVEINTSFYRPHRVSTYKRWATAVPQHFRFAVKVPREITHECRLVDVDAALDRFLREVAGLGDALGPLLVQLPPSFAFNEKVATEFLAGLRRRFIGHVACEPRHVTWFSREVDHLLADQQIARVAADPAVVPEAAQPGGWNGLHYYRLHGSPHMYYSEYSAEYLDILRDTLGKHPHAVPTWCIFDNTARAAATANGLDLLMKWE